MSSWRACHLPFLKLVDRGTGERRRCWPDRKANTRLPVETERRHLLPDQLQRDRLPAPRRDDGRVRARRSRRAGRAHLPTARERPCCAEIARLPRGTLALRDDASTATTSRSRSSPRRRSSDGRASTSTSPARSPRRARRHQRARSPTPPPIRCFGLACVVAPRVPNNAGSLAPLTRERAAPSIVNAPYRRRRCCRATSSARCCRTWSSAACARPSRTASPPRGPPASGTHAFRGRAPSEAKRYGFAITIVT